MGFFNGLIREDFAFNPTAIAAPVDLDLFFPPTAVAPPVNAPVPVILETSLVRSETLSIAPVIGVGADTVPVNPINPVLVSSLELTADTDNDIPVGPPVFFPTVLPDLIKSVGDDLNVTAQAVPVAVSNPAQSIPTAAGQKFTNIDLGLVALGGGAVLITGVIALIRRAR